MPKSPAAHSTFCGISDLLYPLRFQRESDIFEHGHVGIKRVALEDHGDFPRPRRQIVHHFAADEQLAFRGRFETGDHAQQRALAAARRSEQHEKLSVPGQQVMPFTATMSPNIF